MASILGMRRDSGVTEYTVDTAYVTTQPGSVSYANDGRELRQGESVGGKTSFRSKSGDLVQDSAVVRIESNPAAVVAMLSERVTELTPGGEAGRLAFSTGVGALFTDRGREILRFEKAQNSLNLDQASASVRALSKLSGNEAPPSGLPPAKTAPAPDEKPVSTTIKLPSLPSLPSLPDIPIPDFDLGFLKDALKWAALGMGAVGVGWLALESGAGGRVAKNVVGGALSDDEYVDEEEPEDDEFEDEEE